MSVYNSEFSVAESIDSILKQTYKNYEFLILDDGSTDNSLQIIKDMSKKNERIKLLTNKKNLGLTKSLNILIQKSNGDLIARQDADDISRPERLQKQLNYLQKYDLDFCTTRARIMKSKRIIPQISYFLPKKFAINFKNPFIHGTLLIKKSVLLDVGMYDENFYYSQDYKLFTDLLEDSYNFKIMRDPLYELNMQNNISSNHKELQAYFASCVRERSIPKLKDYF